MCTVAPFLLPGLAGAAPVSPDARATMAAYVKGAPAAMRGHEYNDDEADIEALLRDIDAVVRPRTPAGFAPLPVPVADAAGADLPMPSAEFLALYRRNDEDADFDLEAVLRGIRSVRIPATGLAPVLVASVATPTTPVAVLPGPRSYGDDSTATTISLEKQPQQCEYDVDTDATFRAMEKDPAERPSADYLWNTQEGQMTMVDRAELVTWMHGFSGYHNLAPGALHRAVSYADRFLSTKKIHGGARQVRALGAAAVFAAAKYEDRSTTLAVGADILAERAGCTGREVINAESELVAALRYRLSGPTAYTFVDHFTRHYPEAGEGLVVRFLAHHLADLALLDYRCVRFLPSVVAASAIVLAKLALHSAVSWREELTASGYALEDLTGCMNAIYDVHELKGVWPGCAEMMAGCVLRYSLPPR